MTYYVVHYYSGACEQEQQNNTFSRTNTAMGCTTSKTEEAGVDFTDDNISEGRQQSVWRSKFRVPSVYAPAAPDDGNKRPQDGLEKEEMPNTKETKDTQSDKLVNSYKYAVATEGKKDTSAGEGDFTDDKISEGRQQSVWRSKFRLPSVYAPAESHTGPDEK